MGVDMTRTYRERSIEIHDVVSLSPTESEAWLYLTEHLGLSDAKLARLVFLTGIWFIYNTGMGRDGASEILAECDAAERAYGDS